MLAYHEETEICLSLNAKDAIQDKYKRVIAICRETGVLLPGIPLYHLGCTETEVWVISGTSKEKKCYPVHIILSKLHNDILDNILGFHDNTTSSLSDISKKTCWMQYLEAPKLV